MTNNVAEYYGLIAALDYVEAQGIRALRIESDSELLVKQMKGLYKVRSPELAPLYERARKMAAALDSFRIDHVYREHNREADALANLAMDEVEGPDAKPRAKRGAAKAAAPSQQSRGNFESRPPRRQKPQTAADARFAQRRPQNSRPLPQRRPLPPRRSRNARRHRTRLLLKLPRKT